MLIALTSASGSPGVSTSCTGLALAWKRPCLLIEADPGGGSAMLTGYLRQYLPSGAPSVFDLAARLRQTGKVPNLLEIAVRVPDSTVHLISGVRSPVQAPSLSQLWNPMLAQCRDLETAGVDVIFDMGRLGVNHYATPLLDGADLVLLTTRTNLPALVPAKNWADWLLERYGEEADKLGLLLIGAGQPYKANDVAKQLRLTVTATLPTDATTAEVFHLGSTPGRGFDRSPLYRSLPPAAAAITAHMTRPIAGAGEEAEQS